MVQLCRISLRDGRYGPISMDLMLSRKLSSEVPNALTVDTAVFIVLICHWMKPFKLEKCGDKVIWSMCWDDRNFARAS